MLAQRHNYLANFYGNRYFFSLFFVALGIYLVMNLTLSWFARFVARRTGPKLGQGEPDRRPRVAGIEGTPRRSRCRAPSAAWMQAGR